MALRIFFRVVTKKLKLYKKNLIKRQFEYIKVTKNYFSTGGHGWRMDNFAQLIDSDTGGWNHHLVESLFLPFEAQRIMGIPLCMSRQEDCIICPRCNSGVYLVKMSYQML